MIHTITKKSALGLGESINLLPIFKCRDISNIRCPPVTSNPFFFNRTLLSNQFNGNHVHSKLIDSKDYSKYFSNFHLESFVKSFSLPKLVVCNMNSRKCMNDPL